MKPERKLYPWFTVIAVWQLDRWTHWSCDWYRTEAQAMNACGFDGHVMLDMREMPDYSPELRRE